MGNQEKDGNLGEGFETRRMTRNQKNGIGNYKKDGKLGESLKTMRMM